MITDEELNYKGAWAKHAPFPGREYAIKAIENMFYAFEKYIEVFKDSKYNIGFSNGEVIKYQMKDKNVAHLLGIETSNLKSEWMNETVEKVLGLKPNEDKGSYEILKRILERADDVIKNDSDPKNYMILNYYRTLLKSIIFQSLPDFASFDFGVINFDKDNVDEGFVKQESSKYIIIPSYEKLVPYFLLGLKQNEFYEYIPETTLAIDEIEKYLNNQTLILPTSIISNYKGYIYPNEISSRDQINLLRYFRGIIKSLKTNTEIDIYHNYEKILAEQDKIKSYGSRRGI